MKKSILVFFTIYLFNISFVNAKEISIESFLGNSCQINKYNETLYNFNISSDGKSIAYVKKSGNVKMLVKDGEDSNQGSEFNNITYSLNGESFGYMGNFAGSVIQPLRAVVKNGETSNIYDFVDQLTFSDDGKHSAYIAAYGNENGGNSFGVIKDCKNEVTGYEGFVKNCSIYNDKLYSYVDYLRFSPDGNNIYFLVEKEYHKKYALIINGKEVREYNGFIQGLAYSPDFKEVSVALQNEDSTISIYRNDKKVGTYFRAGNLTYSPDSTIFSFSYGDKTGNYKINQNGIDLETVYNGFIKKIVYSTSGKNKAVIVRNYMSDKAYFNGIETGSYPEIADIKFLNNDDVIYYFRNDKYKYFIGINEKISDELESFSNISGIKFMNNGNFAFLNNNSIYNCEYKSNDSKGFNNTSKDNSNIIENKTNEIGDDMPSKYSKQLLSSGIKLKNEKKQSIITKINKIVSITDKEKLQKVYNKLQKLGKKNSVLEYLEAKIYIDVINK